MTGNYVRVVTVSHCENWGDCVHETRNEAGHEMYTQDSILQAWAQAQYRVEKISVTSEDLAAMAKGQVQQKGQAV